MRARGLILFILVNVLVTTGVAFAVISLFSNRDAAPQVVQYATVQVIITATRDPNQLPEIKIITATPRPGEVQDIPTGVLEGGAQETTVAGIDATGDPDASAVPLTTIDPALLEADAALAETVTALPENCVLHALEDGENPALLAEQYGTDVDSILAANGLTEDDAAFLQIGQVLIIPLPGCPLEQLPTPESPDAGTSDGSEGTGDEPTVEGAELTASATVDATATPTVTATITLPPTAADAQIEIVEVTSPGDITTEGVVLRNNGRNVNLTGWTISDLDGNTYTFPERNLFSNGEITLYTGVGQNTAVVMYWGLDQAAWGETGDVVTLKDANGVVQAVYRIPSAQNLP
ncbi:MAG TPA: lamin tail domain-containing protein [Phototrophicaceae bacterium]|jgi:LysM repeat protein|nr:lamin tail domain-containing protein [Phototrophicaceae bacterium]